MIVDFGPSQHPIAREGILRMLTLTPRRMKLSREWPEALHPPKPDQEDWSLVLPFCETLRNAFTACPVDSIGLRISRAGNRCYTFLREADDKSLEQVREWLSAVGGYVALRDCLSQSFALDYDRIDGNPDNAQTVVGALRTRAKPYNAEPTDDTYKAADKLAGACSGFLDTVESYHDVDVVVAMPPSRPDKSFDLPRYLAEKLSAALGKPNMREAVKTVKARPPLKDTALEGKLAALEGTTQVAGKGMKGKVVLLLDDLYQSGVSANYVGMLLLEAGARKIYGLACEKTCRNDDNVK